MHWRTQQKPNSSSIHDFNHSNFCLQEINLMNIKFAPTFTPTMLATHASFFAHPHICSSLLTCLVWNLIMQLFACWSSYDLLTALQGLGRQ